MAETNSETKKELFISYGREPETVNFVRLLKRDLEKKGLTIWLDAEDISAGCDWYSAIGQGLENCKGIIAVITNKYINSHYCKSELYTANNDRKLIFPIMFEDVDFSSSATAKGVKYIISGINWTMFRPSIDDYHTSLARLCQGMKEQGLVVVVEEGEGGAGETDAADTLATQMGHLHMSGTGSSDPPPSAPPHSSYHTPPHLSPHGTGGGYPQPPYPYHPAPYPSSHAPYPPQPHPPYQSTPPYPGYPHQQPQPGYGYTQQPPFPNSTGYSPAQGYTLPPPTQYPGVYAPPTATPPAPPTQHPGMYTPPKATPPAPPTQHPGMYTPPKATPPRSPQPTTDFTDQGPPKYADLYTQPAQPQSTYSPAPLPEKPTSSLDSGSPSKPMFSVGMKLEAVDRRFPYFVCVATIMDRTESEVLVHFDGWSDGYDYWCPHDAVELHPPGWCHTNNWELQTPREQEWHGWDWYITHTEADKAPEHLFSPGQLAGPGSLLFRAGMSVEAKDRHNPSMTCAATIQRIDHQGKLLIHFDGWTQHFDYWCEPSTTDIHPPMWCGKNNKKVEPPNGYGMLFKWSEYLATPGKIPAPAHLFKKEQLSADGRPRSAVSASGETQLGQFKVGMKLEAKDRLNPRLIAVATIGNIRDKKLLIHFDGWTSKYDYWCKPTTPDIHPVGWCAKHRNILQPPKGMNNGTFSWATYLKQTGAKPAPTSAFTHSQQ